MKSCKFYVQLLKFIVLFIILRLHSASPSEKCFGLLWHVYFVTGSQDITFHVSLSSVLLNFRRNFLLCFCAFTHMSLEDNSFLRCLFLHFLLSHFGTIVEGGCFCELVCAHDSLSHFSLFLLSFSS